MRLQMRRNAQHNHRIKEEEDNICIMLLFEIDYVKVVISL